MIEVARNVDPHVEVVGVLGSSLVLSRPSGMGTTGTMSIDGHSSALPVSGIPLAANIEQIVLAQCPASLECQIATLSKDLEELSAVTVPQETVTFLGADPVRRGRVSPDGRLLAVQNVAGLLILDLYSGESKIESIPSSALGARIPFAWTNDSNWLMYSTGPRLNAVRTMLSNLESARVETSMETDVIHLSLREQIPAGSD